MLFDAILRGRAKLFGIIMFGGGLDKDFWVNEAKEQGYAIMMIPGCALLYKVGKK